MSRVIKSRLRGNVLFLFLCGIMLMCLASPASAAVKVARVKQLKGQPSEKRVVLTWKAVSGADGYVIYIRKGTSGSFQKAGRVRGQSKTTYTQKKLKLGQTYSFYVCAYRRKNGKTYYSKASKKITVTTTTKAPAELTGLVGSSRSKEAVLFWSKSKNASGYYVFQKINGKWKTVANTTKLTAVISGLSNGKTYKFRVRPYRKKGTTITKGQGLDVTVTVESLQSQVSRFVTRDVYEVVITKTITVRKLDGSGSVTLYAGDHVGVAWKGYTAGDSTNDHIPEYFVLSDGTMVEGVNGACNPVQDLYWNHSRAYSALAAEYYVNTTNHQTSKTNWCLWINYYTQYCYAFKRKNAHSEWTWYATWETSTGRYGMTQTPRGELEIVKKSVRYYFPGGAGAYGNWASHLTGEGNAIHGPRRAPNGVYLDPGEIGYPLSSGCCRLFDPYAKFVYDNMDIGTRVLVA